MDTQTLIRLIIGLAMTAIVGVFALKRVLYLTKLISSGQPTADERGRKNHLGERIGNQGFFFQPTILAEVPLSAEIMQEEPFGPVAIVNRYADEEAMIGEANRLPYGLAAYAWTSNPARRTRLAAARRARD